jgi:hypothetical protein
LLASLACFKAPEARADDSLVRSSALRRRMLNFSGGLIRRPPWERVAPAAPRRELRKRSGTPATTKSISRPCPPTTVSTPLSRHSPPCSRTALRDRKILLPAMRSEGALVQKSQDTMTKSSGLIASFGNALMTC